MATYNRSLLTDREAILERVMRAVVEQVQDTGFVLKGGTALVFPAFASSGCIGSEYLARMRTA